MIKILFVYLIIINILTLLIYCLDRLTFSKGHKYQKAYSLLVLVLIGGSIGAWLGIKMWPPKNLTNVFRYSIPIIFLLQILTLMFLRYQG